MYNHLKIDMDYCADPIWASEDPIDEESPAFANASIDEFELSPGLKHSLKIYQNLWENANWSCHVSPEDIHNFPASSLIYRFITELELILAGELKKCYPNSKVYVSVYNNGYKLIEVKGHS